MQALKERGFTFLSYNIHLYKGGHLVDGGRFTFTPQACTKRPNPMAHAFLSYNKATKLYQCTLSTWRLTFF